MKGDHETMERKKKKNKKPLIGMIVLFCAILIVSCVKIADILFEREKDIEDFQKLTALIESIPSTNRSSEAGGDSKNAPQEIAPKGSEPSVVIPSVSKPGETEATEAASADTASKPVFTRNLQPLFDKNRDCIGWVSISNTSINYPVMHTPQEPEKYLRKNFDLEYSRSGVPFLQGTHTLDSDNLIIYGHNMQNGTMFSELIKYRNKSFASEHPVIEFETGRGLKLYAVFAVAQIRNSNAWYQFAEASDAADFSDRLTAVTKSALYTTGDPPQYGQQLLTLSTCYGSSKDDRLIVIAVEKQSQ